MTALIVGALVPTAQAVECPVGRWVKATTTEMQFPWRLGNTNKECQIMNPEALVNQGAVVVGCVPGERGTSYIVEPQSRILNNCFSFEQKRFSFPASSFAVQAEAPPVRTAEVSRRIQPRADNLPATSPDTSLAAPSGTTEASETAPVNRRWTDEERRQNQLDSYRRGDPVSVLLDDLMIENTGIKGSEDIDRYHMCLLSQNPGEKSQREKYYENYRAMIAFANRSFRVPIGLLTCTCGRESRFDGRAKNGGATGVCQATGSFLTEVNKWIARPGKIQNEWRAYIDSLGDRLEHSSCRNLPVTKEMIARCPSLGLGTSSIYLRHIFARFEGKRDEMSDEDWARQSVESFAVASGAYNVGVTFADNVLDGVSDRKRWPQHLLKKTCESWLVRSEDPAKRRRELARAEDKFKELKNHLVALRNCLQKENYLDHQGNPMRGECGGTEAQKKKQVAGLERFKSSLPARCEHGQVLNSRPAAADNDARD